TGDISNRAYLLSLVDSIERGIRGSRSPPVDAMLSLSVSGLRLERRVQPQQQQQPPQQMPEVLLRVPVSQLLSVAYVRDSDRHLLALHYSPDANGTSQLCAMSEICAVARQLLQLAYTEATLEFFDRALGGAASTSGGAPSTSGASVLGGRRPQRQRGGSGDSGRAGGGGARTATDSNATPVTSTASSPVIGRRDKQPSRSGEQPRRQPSVQPEPPGAGHVRAAVPCLVLRRLLFRWQRPASAGAASLGEHREHRSSVRSRDSSEVDLDQALGSIVLSPATLASVSAVSASTAGRSRRQPHKYLALDGLEDSASMVAPADSRAKSRQGALADGSRAQILTGL
uniref:CHAT domain-containing protein n=1 Tax=Macrostomum lignano TaxID=282301 RepID=A0A1I8FRQ6_9PLAT